MLFKIIVKCCLNTFEMLVTANVSDGIIKAINNIVDIKTVSLSHWNCRKG